LRGLITCDVLVRTLRAHGVGVRYVRELPSEAPTGVGEANTQPFTGENASLRVVMPDERVWAAATARSAAAVRLESVGAAEATERGGWALSIASLEIERASTATTASSSTDLGTLGWREPEPEVLRHFALTSHYRAPLTLTLDLDERGHLYAAPLDESERRVEYLYRTRERLRSITGARTVESSEVPDEISAFCRELDAALADDLNTPAALALCDELLKRINDLAERAKSKKTKVGRNALLAAQTALDHIELRLGLGGGDGFALLSAVRARRATRCGIDAVDVERRILARVDARLRREYAQADALRDEITSLGIELIDGPEGTHWRIP
jgi:cysteinyl-tRNA synthetase